MKLPPRFSIAALMAVVLVASLSLASLHSGSATWGGGLYLLTLGVFALAIVGAVCRGASERAGWLGFALFGLGYHRGVFAYRWIPELPTTALLDVIRPVGVNPFDARYLGVLYNGPSGYYWVVGHCLWSLLAATIGGVLARALFAAPAGSSAGRDAEPRREDRPARAGWRRFAAVGLVALGTFTAWVLIGLRSDPALWAGALYLLTWGLLGTAALGFACGRGRRRMIWFGAALFGLGYMILNRAPDRFEETSYGHLVADQFLIAVRPCLPPVVSGFPAVTAADATANARIQKALDQPVPMMFRDAAPLEEVLAYIQSATRTSDGRELPIYVDPDGLQEAEKTMQSPIQIDLIGQPLSTTLRVALRQLDMVYYVRDGLVYITSESSEDIPFVVDYYLLLGHCLLALLAAGLGAWLVPLVSDRSAGQPA